MYLGYTIFKNMFSLLTSVASDDNLLICFHYLNLQHLESVYRFIFPGYESHTVSIHVALLCQKYLIILAGCI